MPVTYTSSPADDLTWEFLLAEHNLHKPSPHQLPNIQAFFNYMITQELMRGAARKRSQAISVKLSKILDLPSDKLDKVLTDIDAAIEAGKG